ncbi:MAG: hypothetical protein KF729_21570 [Sandaracinaceae bacterium]|nr:hypothetical protein [Sandaracinaceae bacterium]
MVNDRGGFKARGRMCYAFEGMLTLDSLRRMAERMPSEPVGGSGEPLYRRPDPARTRALRLPTVREEARRAAGSFAFVVLVALAVLVPAGLVAIHLGDLVAGRVITPSALGRSAAWLAAVLAALVVPFAGLGLAAEVVRFSRARAVLGERVVLDATGVLRRADGGASLRLGDGG